MPKSLETTPPIKGQIGSKSKQAQFAQEAAARIHAMLNCPFSLIPEDELVRQTAKWYQAYTEATLRGNTVLIKEWVREEAVKAGQEGFALEDLLGVLRACRQCAIDIEARTEDAFFPMDRAIKETLISLRGRVPWPIAAGTNYLSRSQENSEPLVTDTQILDQDLLAGEKRRASRCQLRLPIRIRTENTQEGGEEITKTTSVSRTGLSFTAAKNYDLGTDLLIVFPYWGADDHFNEEYLARVVRKESLPDGSVRVAIRFLHSLGHKSDALMRQTYQKTRK